MSESIESICASVPDFNAIALIRKDLLHNFASLKEFPSNENIGTFSRLASDSIFDLIFEGMVLDNTINFDPFIDRNTSFVPHLYLLAVIESLSILSKVFTILLLHHHIKFYHASADRYGSSDYDIFCYAP